mgnify:CR=1 FL=1
MNIFVYSDESGVLDKTHNDVFVFGGVIFLDKNSRDVETRKFSAVEKTLRHSGCYQKEDELKACRLLPKDKGKMFRSLNNTIKFGVVINQKKIHEKIFLTKKSKQRYLDYAYKIALKRAFQGLILTKKIEPQNVQNVYIFVDEHTTATDGCYELKEALEQEFKHGTFNYYYNKYHEPIFGPSVNIELKFCDSEKKPLIRAADIVANKIYYCATKCNGEFEIRNNMYIINLP